MAKSRRNKGRVRAFSRFTGLAGIFDTTRISNVSAVLPQMDPLEPRLLLSAWWVNAAANPGGDGSSGNPFQTIQAAANVANAGDIVNILAGIYRETVTPTNSGTAGNPIVYQKSGAGEVIVSGTTQVATGWTLDSGNIYKTSTPISTGRAWDSGLNQVLVNVTSGQAQMMTWARWPNITPENLFSPAWAQADTVSFTDGEPLTLSRDVTLTEGDALLPGNAADWLDGIVHIAVGAELYHQTGQIYAGETDGGVDTFHFMLFNPTNPGGEVVLNYTPQTGDDYYITGARVALDNAGEWFIDTAGYLYFYKPGGGDPTSTDVEVKTRDLAFDLSGKSYITIDGVSLVAATITTSGASGNLLLNNINAKYLSEFERIESGKPWGVGNNTGIVLDGSGNTLMNSTLSYSAGNGVTLHGSNQRIINNTISNVNYTGTDTSGISTGISTDAQTSGNEIAYNTLYNSFRSLISPINLENSTIHHNEMYNAMLQTTDGAAIHGSHSTGLGTVIAYNLVHDIYNSHLSTYGHGIYIDNGGSDYIIHHNVVWNVSSALVLNTDTNDQNHKVYQNTLVGNNYSFYAWGADASHQNMTGTILRNNILVGQRRYADGSTGTNPVYVKASNYIVDSIGQISANLFVDWANRNLNLPADSPARDKGELIPGLLPYSLGYLDGAPDAGALEYGHVAFLTGADANDSQDGRGLAIGNVGVTRLEAEWYDTLGPGVSYYDTTPGNQGTSPVRLVENVDTDATTVMGTASGEYLEYTINVLATGRYVLSFRAGTTTAGYAGDITVSLGDGRSFSQLGVVDVPQSASGTLYDTVLNNVLLDAGLQVVRLTFGAAAVNLDYFDFTPVVFTDDFNELGVVGNTYANPYWSPILNGGTITEPDTNSQITFGTTSNQFPQLNGPVSSTLNFFTQDITLSVENIGFTTSGPDPRFILGVSSANTGLNANDAVRVDVFYQPANDRFTVSLTEKLNGTGTTLVSAFGSNYFPGDTLKDVVLKLTGTGYTLTFFTTLSGVAQAPQTYTGDWVADTTAANWGGVGDTALFLASQNVTAGTSTSVSLDLLEVGLVKPIAFLDHFNNDNYANNHHGTPYWTSVFGAGGSVAESQSAVALNSTVNQLIRLNGNVLSNLDFFTQDLAFAARNITFTGGTATTAARFVMAVSSTNNGIDAADRLRINVYSDPVNSRFTFELLKRINNESDVPLITAFGSNYVAGTSLTDVILTLSDTHYSVTLKTNNDMRAMGGVWVNAAGNAVTQAEWGTGAALFLGEHNLTGTTAGITVDLLEVARVSAEAGQGLAMGGLGSATLSTVTSSIADAAAVLPSQVVTSPAFADLGVPLFDSGQQGAHAFTPPVASLASIVFENHQKQVMFGLLDVLDGMDSVSGLMNL